VSSLLDSFPHTCTAKRRIRTKGSLGGSKETFPTTTFTGRACWQQPAGEALIREFQKRGITVTNKVYFTADPGLDERDILIIGSDTFEVRSKANPDASAGLGIVYRILCEKTTTGSTP